MSENLTRAFFEDELKGLAAAYAKDCGVEKVAIDLMLKNGHTLRIEGDPVCTDTYVVIDHKHGRAVLPYRAIVGVGLAAKGGGSLGFHR